MQDQIDEEVAELTIPKRGRPTKEEAAAREGLEALKVEKESLARQLAEQSAIRAALESGRERTDPREEAKAERSGGRIPMSSAHQRLTVEGYEDQLAGHVPRWFNDEGDRLMRALQGGYKPIIQTRYGKVGDGENLNDDKGTWVSQPVGTMRSGAPMRAYLLALRQDLYDEDQASKRQRVKETEDTIKGGRVGSGDMTNRYVKTVSIGR